MSDLASPDQFVVGSAVALAHLNLLIHVDFGTVPVANFADPRHQVDPVTPLTPHLRGFQAVPPLLGMAFEECDISEQLAGARGRLENFTTTSNESCPIHISSLASSLLQVPKDKYVIPTLLAKCLINCFDCNCGSMLYDDIKIGAQKSMSAIGREKKEVRFELKTHGSKRNGDPVILVVNACASRDLKDNVVGVCFVA